MALELNLTKNTNDAIQGTLGKYYARVEYKGTIGLRDLASHMHHHNTAFSKGIINGVLNDMVDCIKELALLGYVVKIDDLGLFKVSVDANGLTLENGAKITAGRGAQRTDEELEQNIGIQQFAVGAVKLIMQATGETTIDNMNRDARLAFTSKTKAMIKSLTGSDSTDDPEGTDNANGGGTNGGGENTGGNGGTNEGDNTQNGGGDNTGNGENDDPDNGDDNGGGGGLPGGGGGAEG